MTKKYFRAFPSVVALMLLLSFCASPVRGQISFGRMRDASEKNAPPLPEVDDQEKDAPAKTSGKTTVKPQSKSSGSAAEKPAPSEPAPDPADALPPEDDAVEAPNATNPANTATSARRTRPSTRTATSAAGAGQSPSGATSTGTAASSATSGKPIGENGHGPRLGRAVSHKYRAGMIFQAQPGGTCTNVFGSAPIPMEFPEQKVRTLEEEFPKSAKVDYRDLKEGGARQLVFKMRELRAGNGVQASALFEVTRYPILPPTDLEIYSIPKNVTKDIRQYLRESKYMESNAKTIRSLAKETTSEKETAWEKVAAILDYVRSNIQYKDVLIEKQMRGALAALKTRDGDCEDMSALFIAMCRAIDVPARLVRVPGHCWAEFYLVDDEKVGFWFPAQVAGTEELGSLQDTRVILQKGDAFHIPEEPKESQLYVKELFMGTVKDNGPDPKYQFIQETDAR